MSTSNTGGSKAERREAAIAALLCEPTHALAAEKAGIGLATLQRWLRKPAFVSAFRRARRRVVEHAIGRLQNTTGEAVEALRRNLSAAKSGDQIRAALGILDHANRAIGTLDLLERVEQLESLLKDLTNGPDEPRYQTADPSGHTGEETATEGHVSEMQGPDV
jgi:hypothetical protein